MNKMYPIALAILLVSLLGFASCFKKSPENVKPLSGEETAQLVSKFYNELGPRIGSHLVEPNAVLTIAGLRGDGKFFMQNLTADEKNKIEKVNEMAKEFGIKFVLSEEVVPGLSDIGILNFKGLEYISKKSKLPFVVPYDASTGIEGMRSLLGVIRDKASTYFKNNGYVKQESDSDLPVFFLLGLTDGYPDQALMDRYRNSISDEKPLVTSKISMSDYYQNPGANFSYFAEHENEESIVNAKKAWGDLLEGFYNSSWHKALAKDPDFIKARKAEDNAHDEWMKKTH